MATEVTIWTDGSCYPNPGPGGWGVILCWKGQEKEIKGGEKNTTNNRMELLGAIMGLRALTRPCKVILWTDSEYVQKGMMEYRYLWMARKWAKVKNVDLWKELVSIHDYHLSVEYKWCKGHAGNRMNERVDKLALAGRLENT